MGRKEVAQTWRSYWRGRRGSIRPSKRPTEIFQELRSIVGDFRGKRILEGGSGIGEISIDVAASGGFVYLLDVSRDALVVSRTFFRKRNLVAAYLNGSVFHLPFREGTFDIVWNAGVVEHFQLPDQTAILREFRRVVKSNGLVIMFNPYANAKLYRWGKRTAENRGTWEFGEEYPIETMRHIAEEANLRFIEEHTFFFRPQITFLKYVSPVAFRLYKTAYILTGGRYNPLWEKRYGGYLLVSVMKRV